MKTIRLLYPDWASGGLDAYWLGAELMAIIAPPNERQPLFRVPIEAPDGKPLPEEEGVCGRRLVEAGIAAAQKILEAESPDKVVTIGGNCMASLAPFDYLHQRHPDAGIIWIDAHPDVSTPADGYPCAHAMVLGSLLGGGDARIASLMKAAKFRASDVLYVGLQGLHDYQQRFLDEAGVNYQVQTEAFVPLEDVSRFASRFKTVFVHFDIDVLDPAGFHSTYFANPELTGDGSGGGRMTMPQLAELFKAISSAADVSAFTIAEHLPFEALKLREALSHAKIFSE